MLGGYGGSGDIIDLASDITVRVFEMVSER